MEEEGKAQRQGVGDRRKSGRRGEGIEAGEEWKGTRRRRGVEEESSAKKGSWPSSA